MSEFLKRDQPQEAADPTTFLHQSVTGGPVRPRPLSGTSGGATLTGSLQALNSVLSEIHCSMDSLEVRLVDFARPAAPSPGNATSNVARREQYPAAIEAIQELITRAAHINERINYLRDRLAL